MASGGGGGCSIVYSCGGGSCLEIQQVAVVL